MTPAVMSERRASVLRAVTITGVVIGQIVMGNQMDDRLDDFENAGRDRQHECERDHEPHVRWLTVPTTCCQCLESTHQRKVACFLGGGVVRSST